MDILPAVSIVIITKDRHSDLCACVASIRAMDYPRHLYEIVVVEEADRPQRVDEVKYIHIPRKDRGFGYARNIGISNSSHELIAFTDDDCRVSKGWLKELVKVLTPDVGGATGGVLVSSTSAVGYCETVLGFPNGGLQRIHNARNRPLPTKYLSTCNCIYRKNVFDTVGGFIEYNSAGEDMELAQRVTKKFTCLFVPGALVYHKARGDLCKIFQWFVTRGRGQVRIGRFVENKKDHIVFCIKNSMTLRSVVVIAILFIVGKIRWLLLCAGLVMYYLLLLKRYAFQLQYLKRIDTFFLTPIVKFVMDWGMDTGLIGELSSRIIFRGRKKE
jgi:GT2 family glycosyltransferase